MAGLSRFVLRHKLVVAVFWLVVLAVGVVASARLSGRLSAQFALPGAASYRADQQILRDYGNGGPGYPEVVVVRLPPGRSAASAAGRRTLGAAFTAVAARPGPRVADYASTGNRGFLTGDPQLSYGLVFTPYTGELSPPSLGPQITATMRPALPPGSAVAVTGMNEPQSGGQAREGFGVLAETLLAGAAALGVLVFVFGSALAIPGPTGITMTGDVAGKLPHQPTVPSCPVNVKGGIPGRSGGSCPYAGPGPHARLPGPSARPGFDPPPLARHLSQRDPGHLEHALIRQRDWRCGVHAVREQRHTRQAGTSPRPSWPWRRMPVRVRPNALDQIGRFSADRRF